MPSIIEAPCSPPEADSKWGKDFHFDNVLALLNFPKGTLLNLPAASCRESSKCKEVIPSYCSSLANPAAPATGFPLRSNKLRGMRSLEHFCAAESLAPSSYGCVLTVKIILPSYLHKLLRVITLGQFTFLL